VTAPLLLKRTEAARYLGVHPKTFDRMRAAGAIKPVDIPGTSRPLYSREQLEQLARNEQ
jgi:hypothetical protein